MNKAFYKVIFSKIRGCMVVVAENARGNGKRSCRKKIKLDGGFVEMTPQASIFLGKMTALAVSLLAVISSFVSLSTEASIRADNTAPHHQQAVILQTANGLPQVNIQTPTRSGVSVNQFKQFDVDNKGAVLNNARSNTQTQLAGWIQANPYLAKGEATIIVNQVNSSDPSHLNGYVEVGGKRAEVVMANPSGIKVNGAGFINASSVTLSTGQPVIQDGGLVGYQIEQGRIEIEGGGLDTASADYTQILSQAAKINAGVWAKELEVVTGRNQVSHNGAINQIYLDHTTPAVAIDTQALGGMYAEKIILISTQQGAEIQNAGQIWAMAGGVSVSAEGKLVNSGSLVAAEKNKGTQNVLPNQAQAKISIKSTALHNSGVMSAQGQLASTTLSVKNSGTLLSANKLSVKSEEHIVNAENGIVQGASLHIETQQLDNQGKIIQTGQQVLQIESEKLENEEKAYIGFTQSPSSDNSSLPNSPTQPIEASNNSTANASNANVNQPNTTLVSNSFPINTTLPNGMIKVAHLKNEGKIEASGGINLSSKKGLTNRAELVLNKLNVSGEKLDNQQGKLTANQFEIHTESLVNQQGRLTALQRFSAKVESTFDNYLGLVQSADVLNLSANQLNNRTGKIAVAGKAELFVENLLNQQAGSIDVDELHITGRTIDNQQGVIRVAKTNRLNTSINLNNQDGVISANKQLSIVSDQTQLNINNDLGTLLSSEDLTIQAKQLSNKGEVIAGRDSNIQLKDDFANQGGIISGATLALITQGSLQNQQQLQAGKSIFLTALQIENTAAGKIQSPQHTELVADNGITNRGLINSQGITHLQSQDSIENVGTGRIYGQHLAISANQLLNREENLNNATKAAVIAARERLDLGVSQLENREEALIFSAGDLYIGGKLDLNQQVQGKAETLHNRSAKIEALGNIDINVKNLSNTNDHLSFHTEETLRENRVEYEAAGRNERYPEGSQQELDWKIFEDESLHMRTPDGQNHERWSKYVYERVVTESKITESRPAQLISGGRLRLDLNRLHNQDSQIIAGGTLSLDNADALLDNQETLGTKTITDQGTRHNYYRKRRKGRDTVGLYYSSYRPAPEVNSIRMGIWEFKDNANVKQQTPETPNVENPQKITALSTQNQLNHEKAKPFQLPNNSLFAIAPNNKGYLIETDPTFSDYRHWLGSDYMLSALQTDPSYIHKRLGDGYYEQRLVNEQIVALTGYRYLEGYQNDEEQFKSLMNAGISFAQAHQLRIGIALSAEQVAQLTSDIIWLENETITLPDGRVERVLKPKVYMRVRANDLNAQGALLSAAKININADIVRNRGGMIAGREALLINSQNLQNLKGGLYSRHLQVSTHKNILNTGDIRAEKALLLKAGGNITSRSELNRSENEQGSVKNIDRLAGIYITGDSNGILALEAGKNINLQASLLQNQSSEGKTQLKAGENIQLSTLEISRTQENRIDADNYALRNTSQEVGSRINTKGDVQLIAGQDIHLRASDVSSSEGITSLQASQNIRLEAGKKRTLTEDAFREEGHSGGGNNQVINVHMQNEQEQILSSSLDGKQVVVQAGADLNVKGSHIISEADTLLVADNIAIDSEQATQRQSSSYSKEKSGLMSSGGIGFTIGSKKERLENDNIQLTQVSSQIGSLKGNTHITAGNQYQQTGSVVTAVEGDVNIQAKNIVVSAAKEDYQQKQGYQFEQSGFTVALNVPALQAIQGAISVVKSTQKVGESNNNRINALAAANAGFSALRSFEGLNSAVDATKALANGDMKNANISVSITYGEQKNQQQTDIQGNTAHASQINAGGKVNLIASGDKTHSNINIVGSDISGKKGTALFAANNINLLAAEQTHQERSTNKSAGWNAGVAISYGQNGLAFGVTAGGNYGKGYGNGDEQSFRGSRIGDKHSQTTIHSQADTNIKGSQVSGEKVSLKAENLNIESLQDTMTYKGKQQNMQAQVTIGYGFSASGSYNRSNVNADYASVTTQAGIFAGDEGYDVAVEKNTDLKGAVILSSAEKDKNRLTTQDFTYSDIQNHSSASASSMGLAGGLSIDRDQTSAEDKALNKQYREGREGETFTQANQNQANASRLKFGLGENDVHSTDGYAMAKLGLVNALSNSKESESQSSITKSSISDGVFTVQSEQGKRNIHDIPKSNVEQTNKLEKIDHHKLQSNVKNDVATIQEFAKNVAGFTDEAYRTMFIAEHRMMTFVTDENGVPEEDSERINQLKNEARQDAIARGITEPEKVAEHEKQYYKQAIDKGYNIYKLRELSDQERQNIKPITYINPTTGRQENKYVVAFNGIMNDMQDAAKFVLQNYVAGKNDETGEISKKLYKDMYFVHHPKARGVSELLVAGYQKWAVSSDNSVRQAVDLMKEKGSSAEGLYLGGHSRGTLTLSNALQHLDKDKQNIGLLSNTTLKMVGPAANVTRADTILNRLQGRGDERLSKVGSIIIENSKHDTVGSSLLIGNNPYTIELNTLNKSKYALLKDIVSNTSLSSHNCYGLGQPQCITDGYRRNTDSGIMQPEVTIFELNNKIIKEK